MTREVRCWRENDYPRECVRRVQRLASSSLRNPASFTSALWPQHSLSISLQYRTALGSGHTIIFFINWGHEIFMSAQEVGDSVTLSIHLFEARSKPCHGSHVHGSIFSCLRPSPVIGLLPDCVHPFCVSPRSDCLHPLLPYRLIKPKSCHAYSPNVSIHIPFQKDWWRSSVTDK